MRQKTKVFVVAVLAFALVIMLAYTAQADDYSGHWSAQYINDAASRGWMTGDGNGNFRPESAITRGEFAVMLWRALGQPEPNHTCPFNDVVGGAFYYKAVTLLFEREVVNGLNATTYGPNVTLTREMGCTMLARAYKLNAENVNAYQRFADAGEVSEWARPAISALVEKNYIAGIGDNKIAPKQYLKRGEMAKLLITVAVSNESAAAAAQQNAVAALGAYVSGPAITIKQTVLGSDEVRVTVTAKDDWGVTFVGWRYSEKDATYKSKSGFTDITATGDMEFIVDENGWYAVYSENKNGYGSFKLFEVTTIREDTPKVSLTQKTLASGLVEITVNVTKVSGGAAIDTDSLAYRTAKEGDSFSSKSGFNTKITANTFTVDPAVDYGWYAVCALDMDGKFGYRLIEVEKVSSNNTVTFDADGGAPVPLKQTVAYNTKASKPTDPAKSGFIFDGWYNGSTEWDFAADTVTKDITLKAKWVDSSTTYTVSFDSQGGSAVSPLSNVTHGATISKPGDPLWGSDVFDGWYKEAACVNSWNFASDIVKSDITLYAKWITPPTITTSSLDLDGGVVGTAYTETTLAASGDPPITWSIDSGALPDGLTLSAAGVISGTPTVDDTFNFTVKATNAAGSDTQALIIVIDP